MGSIAAIEVLNNTKLLTQDLKNVFWVNEEMQTWLNAGQREIAINRPDAYSVIAEHTCVQSATQTIPADGLRFLDCTHNKATGYVIMPANRADLDQVQRNWQSSANPVAEVEHYIFDERFPKYFKLYPVPVAGTVVEIGYSATPPPIALTAFDGSDDTPIAIDDNYANQLMDYMLARMYMKNTTLTNAANKSQLHFSLFYQSLGLKFNADKMTSPQNPENRND